MTPYAEHLSDATLAIFIFHGVVPEHRHRVRNYTRKHLDAATFAAVIGELRAAGTPLSMDDVVELTESGKPFPSRAFAITFDDGFRNNLEVAAPILREHGIPATFYVTSGWVEHNTIPWIDQVEQAFEVAGTIELRTKCPALNRVAKTVADKQALLSEIRAVVKFQNEMDPADFASEVTASLGVKPVPDPFLDQKLNWDEVRALDSDVLFTVGGHSHTHRILSALGKEELDEEIDVSLRLITRSTGRPVRHYSYPDGFAGCYSAEVIETLRSRGIVCSPTAEEGVNEAGADLFRLKRIFVT